MILSPTIDNIKKAARIIKNGGVVAFPTETVYGLGADATNKDAVLKIFEIKKRPKFDPLIVHIATKSDVLKIAYLPKEVEKLIELWPAPLTIVLPKKKIIPDIVTSGLDSVGIRMPDNKIAIDFIKESKTFIAAPSANKFTKLSPTKPQHILKQLGDIPIIDGGKTVYGIESTIIKYQNGDFYLLRPGAFELEKIEKIIGKKLKRDTNKRIEAPGQFKKHYSPDKKVIIVKDETKIKNPKNSAYIYFDDNPQKNFSFKFALSKNKDIREAASNLFDLLHKADEKKIKFIYVQRVLEKGLGVAIMDRLKKAAK